MRVGSGGRRGGLAALGGSAFAFFSFLFPPVREGRDRHHPPPFYPIPPPFLDSRYFASPPLLFFFFSFCFLSRFFSPSPIPCFVHPPPGNSGAGLPPPLFSQGATFREFSISPPFLAWQKRRRSSNLHSSEANGKRRREAENEIFPIPHVLIWRPQKKEGAGFVVVAAAVGNQKPLLANIFGKKTGVSGRPRLPTVCRKGVCRRRRRRRIGPPPPSPI